jgi:hypothetical protein
MSETTHTPGPWRTGRKVFRTIYCEEHGTEGRPIGVMDRREDATLAAASPKLLAALRDMVSAALTVAPGVPDDVLERAVVALSEADGREP